LGEGNVKKSTGSTGDSDAERGYGPGEKGGGGGGPGCVAEEKKGTGCVTVLFGKTRTQGTRADRPGFN